MSLHSSSSITQEGKAVRVSIWLQTLYLQKVVKQKQKQKIENVFP